MVQHMSDEVLSGWVKPVARPRPETLKACIAELRGELAQAENQLRQREEGARLEVLVKVCNLMRAFELTPANLGLEAPPRRCRRPRKAPSGETAPGP
jgi:hypothetical protein